MTAMPTTLVTPPAGRPPEVPPRSRFAPATP